MPIARSVEQISPELALVDRDLDAPRGGRYPMPPTVCVPRRSTLRTRSVRYNLPRRGSPAGGSVASRACSSPPRLASSRPARPDGRSLARRTRRPDPSASIPRRARKAPTRAPRTGDRRRRRPVGRAPQAEERFACAGVRFPTRCSTTSSSGVAAHASATSGPAGPAVDVRRESLVPGVYRWFVYPALGTGSSRRYGALVAQGVVKV